MGRINIFDISNTIVVNKSANTLIESCLFNKRTCNHFYNNDVFSLKKISRVGEGKGDIRYGAYNI